MEIQWIRKFTLYSTPEISAKSVLTLAKQNLPILFIYKSGMRTVLLMHVVLTF